MNEGSKQASPPETQDVSGLTGLTTAGAMLRKARQARGLHIAALATSIKVAPRKLELLEADRYDELLDLTFARALAQTVCKSLRIDPAPVLALLPKVAGKGLDYAESSINEPFLRRPGRASRPARSDGKSWHQVFDLRWLLPALLVLAAAAVYLVPGDWRWVPNMSSPSASNGSAALPATSTSPAQTETVLEAAPVSVELLPPADTASVPLVVLAPPESASAAAVAVALLELRVAQNAWVEVQDANSKPLISRLVQAGETVNLDGIAPLRLKVGNASNTTVRFRGELVDLTSFTRDNVARIELK